MDPNVLAAGIHIDEARANAILTARFFEGDNVVPRFVLPDSAVEERTRQLLGGEPLLIHDVHGQLVFYEFAGDSGNGNELRVRSAANRLLAAPVFSVYVGPPVDVNTQIALANRHAVAASLVPIGLPLALVVYSYPKLGLLCDSATGERYVVDLFEFTISRVEQPRATLEARAETPAVWSPLDRVHAASIGELTEEWVTNLSVFSESEAGPAGAEEYVIAGVKCVPQQNERFCAAACAKMILNFHGIDASQEKIAEAMKTRGDGSTNEDQVKAYGELSSHDLVAKLDSTASFLEAKSESQLDRPMKSGIPGHARVVAGWRTQSKGDLTSSWMWILDPWPVGSGRTYWENWDAVPHSNFIYVRRSP